MKICELTSSKKNCFRNTNLSENVFIFFQLILFSYAKFSDVTFFRISCELIGNCFPQNKNSTIRLKFDFPKKI